MEETVIKIENLCKSFGSLNVLKDVNLEVKKGEIISIIGGSGCGKSVFLRCIELLEIPDSGKIFIKGKEITAKKADINKIRQKMGMVYQNFFLFDHLNVMDNLCLAPCKLLKMERNAAEEKALKLLDMVGLAWKSKEMTNHLSGGQKQRIAIARALMMDPEILLFDEPTSSLDPTMVGEVLATMRMLAKSGLTMIIVTHEFNFAKDVSRRILFMAEKGIYEQGTPKEIFENPKKELTIAFVNKTKSIHEEIRTEKYDFMEIRSKIYTFSERYGFSEKKAYRTCLCLEEILTEYIKNLNGQFPVEIDFSIEYSEQNKQKKILLTSKGPEYNIFDMEDDEEYNYLGITIVKNASVNYSWKYEKGKNTINVVFD